MSDNFELMLASYVKGYAQGIKEKEKMWNDIIDLFNTKGTLNYVDAQDVVRVLKAKKEELFK